MEVWDCILFLTLLLFILNQLIVLIFDCRCDLLDGAGRRVQRYPVLADLLEELLFMSCSAVEVSSVPPLGFTVTIRSHKMETSVYTAHIHMFRSGSVVYFELTNFIMSVLCLLNRLK